MIRSSKGFRQCIDCGSRDELEERGCGTRHGGICIPKRDGLVDVPELRVHGREEQQGQFDRCGEERVVVEGEVNAYRRRNWSFLVGPGLCSD